MLSTPAKLLTGELPFAAEEILELRDRQALSERRPVTDGCLDRVGFYGLDRKSAFNEAGGAFGMAGHAAETTVSGPAKVVIFNNSTLGFVAMEMKAAGLLEIGTSLQNPDFAAMARAIGIKALPASNRSAMMSR